MSTWPALVPLAIHHRDELVDFIHRHPPYADFNFVNLFCFDTRGAFRWSMLHGNLVVRFLDYLTQEPFYSFLGDQQPEATVAALLEQSRREGLAPRLRFVPALAVDAAGAELATHHDIAEDDASFDYVLSVSAVAHLDTPEYTGKASRVRQLRRRHPDVAVRALDLTEPHVQRDVAALFERWCTRKGRSAVESEVERVALTRCLQHAEALRPVTVGVYVRGALAAFTTNDVLPGGFAMGQFGKADPDERGLGELLESATAQHLLELGCTHLNVQQDLGLPGLRAAKQSWRPVGFLKKLTITARS